MRTEQFIDLLARQAGPAPRWKVEARLGVAVLVGSLASAAVAIAGLGVNAGLAMGVGLAVKVAYVAGLLFGAAWLASRVARPATSPRDAGFSLAVVTATMAVIAAAVLTLAPSGERVDLFLGGSWDSCPWRVAALSVPAFMVIVWAMRGLAPTRLRLAGFTAGLLAGTLGALGYALYCTETSPLFVAVWYTLGILIPAGVGAALGPWLLRW